MSKGGNPVTVRVNPKPAKALRGFALQAELKRIDALLKRHERAEQLIKELAKHERKN